MPASLADRNLLFGILAFQMDFIARDALIEAMNAWVLDKSKSLGAILTEKGHLTQSRHSLLDSLVREHLAQHGNDAQKSLGAVELVDPLRQELESLSDVDLCKSLAARFDHPSGTPLAETASAPAAASIAGRFAVLRPHAQGGLGQVYVARDLELNREIALKEIHARLAGDAASRSRFIQEAEITSRLEHPGIIPVYGLGQHPDGRPFYAMRFIRGDTLRDAIQKFHGVRFDDSRSPSEAVEVEPESTRGRAQPQFSSHNLDFRHLLGRFVDVCNAIGYAHSRGILHRDLKPSNIMLGDFGETLVVDWGLAKVLGKNEPARAGTSDASVIVPAFGSSSAETMTGAAIGTPAFMSPEQAVGKIDELSPATDVYGLGATLYCILTGRPPFVQGDVGETLRKVERGEFRRPREHQPLVTAALEAVCLKAMSNKPQDRYPTPQALAEDIEHWLADEPVAAWREPLAVQTRRWARRHRTLVTSAAALFLASVIAGSLGFVALSREQAATETARAEAVAAAQTAKAQAETTQAVSGFLKGMFEEPTPYAFFSINVGVHEGDAEADALLGRAADRLAAGELDGQPEIKAGMLATIGKAYVGLGLLDKAAPLLEEAVQLHRGFVLANGSQLSDCLMALAQTRFFQGRTIEAETLALECLKLRRRSHAEGDEAILQVKFNLGILYSLTAQHTEEADRLWREVLESRKARLRKDDPAIAEALVGLAGNCLRCMWNDPKQVGVAIPLFLEATRIFRTNEDTRELGAAISAAQYAMILQRIGDINRSMQRGEEAYTGFREFLGERHPVTLVVAGFYACGLFELGQESEAGEAFDQLFEDFREQGIPFLLPGEEQMIVQRYVAHRVNCGEEDSLEETLREVRERQLQRAEWHSDGGHAVFASLVQFLHDRGRRIEADALVAQYIGGITGPSSTASSHYVLSTLRTLRRLGYFAESLTLLRHTVHQARWLVENGPAELPGIARSRRLYLASQLAQLGGFLVSRGKPDQAESAYREALAIRRGVFGTDHLDIARDLEALAYCLEQQEKRTEKDALLAESAAIKQRLAGSVKDAPRSPDGQRGTNNSDG